MSNISSPIYDLRQTFEENCTYGPFWNEQLPTLPNLSTKYDFLGTKLSSRFGVAACPLTVNSRYLSLLSRLGYDLLTYKSVRSLEWRGNKFPHWFHVDVSSVFDSFSSDQAVQASFNEFDNKDVTMANSFGIHSLKPEYWQEDFEVAQQKIKKGQLLILSLMTTPQEGQTLVDDSKKLAKLAAETSAKVFELNLACPNTDGGKGLIYDDVETSTKMCVVMKKAIGKRPLLVKVGYYGDQNLMKKFMDMTKDVIAGLATTNTYSRKVVDQNGQEIFPGRPTAGISGAAIRKLSMTQAKNAVQFKKELGLKNFVVIGIGGVTKPEHIQQYLDLGVDAVQTAVGAWADPYLANKYKAI